MLNWGHTPLPSTNQKYRFIRNTTANISRSIELLQVSLACRHATHCWHTCAIFTRKLSCCCKAGTYLTYYNFFLELHKVTSNEFVLTQFSPQWRWFLLNYYWDIKKEKLFRWNLKFISVNFLKLLFSPLISIF